MSRHALMITAALVGATLATTILLVGRKIAHEPRLPVPGYLPAAARGVLDHRMGRHAEHMDALSRAVILLDYPEVTARAEAIATEPKLARPTGEDATELNALLPTRFFELQDGLQRAAQRIVVASRAQDLDALATAHAELTQACVTCHGVYLRGAPSTPGR